MRSRTSLILVGAIGTLALSTLVIAVRCSSAQFGVETTIRNDGTQAETAPEAAATQRYAAIERSRGEGNLVPGNDVRLLVDGRATYDAMLEAIASARHHIHVETYIMQDDDAGERIADALIERRRAGVDVRLIYDGYGGTDSDAFWDRLRQSGVLVHEFNPPEPSENFDFADYDHRDHRKVLIVDGSTGFTGGINFYDAYLNGSFHREQKSLKELLPGFGSDTADLAWRDTHVRVDGPAVRELQRIFIGLWEQVEGPIDDPGLFPQVADSGDAQVRFEVGIGGNAKLSETYAAYLDVFEQARRRIWVTQAYFVPDRTFLGAMAQAARRGVDVKLIVPGVTDVSLILYASRQLYGDLLEAGVQIFEYQDAILHAKTMVVDGAWSIVGSSNLDALSFLRNHEVDAIVVGGDFAREMERLFIEDLRHTRQVTPEAWRDRPLGYRVLGAVAGWFEPWL